MNYTPVSLPMPATFSRATDEMSCSIYDLEASFIASRQDDDVLMEPVGHSHSVIRWYPDPYEGIRNHEVSGRELQIMGNTLEIANLNSTAFSNGPVIDICEGTAISCDNFGATSVGLLEEDALISDPNQNLDLINADVSLGMEGFADNLESMDFLQNLGLGNLNPSQVGITGFDLGLTVPEFDNNTYTTGFSHNNDSISCLNMGSHSMVAMPYPTLQAVNTGSYWPGPHTGAETHHFSQVANATGIGFDGSAAIPMTDWLPPYPFLGQQWSSQCTAGDLPLHTQNRRAAEQQFDHTVNRNSIVFADANPLSHGTGISRANASPSSQAGRKRIRHSRSKWEEANKHTYRLNVIEHHTAEEIRFEMSVIHGFDASASVYRRQLAQWEKPRRTRAARALPNITQNYDDSQTDKVLEIISERNRKIMVDERRRKRKKLKQEREQRRQEQIKKGNKEGAKKREANKKHTSAIITKASIGPFLSTIYIHQERLFHSIDIVIKGLFATGRKSWIAGADNFKPPPNTPNHADAWQRLSDQTASIRILVEAELYNHVNFMLGQVLEGLRVTARFCDPSSMVHFWTICYVLGGIPLRSKAKDTGNPWLRWFLWHLKQALSSAFTKHSLLVILDSLLEVWAESPRDLKTTLGLAHWKATHTLGSMIGYKHGIVLNMGASCAKSWKSKFSVSDSISKILAQPLPTTNASNIEAEMMANRSVNRLSTVAKGKYNDQDVVAEAYNLLTWAGELCREKVCQQVLRYDSVTRAFVLSSELVAKHHLETWTRPGQKDDRVQDRELSFRYMDEAIEILRHGDIHCCIQAVSFSRTLRTWIRANRGKMGDRSRKEVMEEEKKKIQAEKSRTREIVRRIAKKKD
ncbi:hypothetical protein F4818DRAFT_169790 [Hypoxylon cercidicola]|nr:hypothetical protein F4818DRAFT_169790 [Hypoxylon cercidicola]